MQERMLEKYVSKLNTFFKTVWNIRKMLDKKKKKQTSLKHLTKNNTYCDIAELKKKLL